MIKVVVDVKRNDYEDINCGGPQILGYTFYVNDSEDTNELTKAIKDSLKKVHLPCLSINFYPMKQKIWTKDEIINCIESYNKEFD